MLEQVLSLGRRLNQLMQEKAPWKVRKEDPDLAHAILAELAHGIKALAILLSPICPAVAQTIWEQLGFSDQVEKHHLSEATKLMGGGQKIGQNIAPVVSKLEDGPIEEQIAKLVGLSNA